jgi:hypothetical protein
MKPAKASSDLVLQEIWRIKDKLSAARGHDVHRSLSRRARARNAPAIRWPICPSNAESDLKTKLTATEKWWNDIENSCVAEITFGDRRG